jgi:flagellar biosynthetic protein FliR
MAWDIIPADLAWFLGHAGACVLVFARVLGLCLTAPGLAVPGLDWRFRLGLAAALGSVLAPVVAMRLASPPDWPSAAWAGLAEVLTGGVLGWSAGLIVAGAQTAGELVAAQAGLSTATLFDPESGEELAPLGRLYGLLAMAAFLAMDGPLALVRALVDSYSVIPAGRLAIADQAAALAFGPVGRALELALRAAAPAAIALVMAGIVLGWLSRTAPALPLLALALPIRALLGVVLILLSLTTLVVTLAAAWDALPWAVGSTQ